MLYYLIILYLFLHVCGGRGKHTHCIQGVTCDHGIREYIEFSYNTLIAVIVIFCNVLQTMQGLVGILSKLYIFSFSKIIK